MFVWKIAVTYRMQSDKLRKAFVTVSSVELSFLGPKSQYMPVPFLVVS